MNVLELFDAVNSGPVAPGTRQDDEKMLARIAEQFARMQRKVVFYEKYARIPSRKWEFPMSAVTWVEYGHSNFDGAWQQGQLTAPSGRIINIYLCESDTSKRAEPAERSQGFVGLSHHAGDMLHIGTPGFAFNPILVEIMEELERAGIAHPLPTKIGILDADGNEVKMTVYAQPLPEPETASRY